jgi:hypothetical protein
LNPPQERTRPLQRYGWETTLSAIIAAVIATLAVVTRLSVPARPSDRPTADVTATSKLKSWQSLPGGVPTLSASDTDRPARPSSPPPDPHEAVIGPNTIAGRFILMATTRKQATPTTDELTLRLRVVSLAAANLVTPFQSGMVEVRTQGQDPIHPQHAFSHPVAAGNSREEDLTFTIPPSLSLDHSTLRIQYFNEMKEIPLNLPPRPGRRP